jgi:hypothetical protein
MAKRTPVSARDTAVARAKEILGELRRLSVAFPDLDEAVDDDDLPIGFLLRRGADRARDREARLKEAAKRSAPARKRPARKAARKKA